MFPKRRRKKIDDEKETTPDLTARSGEVFCTDYIFPFLSSIPSVILLVNLQKETLRKTECGVSFLRPVFSSSTDKVRFL